MPTNVQMSDYDIVVVNTSGGKDSQTMMRVLATQAEREGVSDRLVAVHADLGRVEWPGTATLAETQADHYGLRFIKVTRPQGDLLDHIEDRHRTLRAKGDTTTAPWPSSAARYCTSDHKRGQVRRVLTGLVRELDLDRPARVLNCMGLRAQESSARAKKVAFRYDASASGKGTVRKVWEWLPILDWTIDEVWADIRAHDVPHHEAYDQGMPRLSCCFCVLASRPALVRAAQLAPDLAERYVALEARTGFTFQAGASIADIVEEARNTPTPVLATDWAA